MKATKEFDNYLFLEFGLYFCKIFYIFAIN